MNRLRSGRKGSFAETGYWIERRSVGRQENMLPAVAFSWSAIVPSQTIFVQMEIGHGVVRCGRLIFCAGNSVLHG